MKYIVPLFFVMVFLAGLSACGSSSDSTEQQGDANTDPDALGDESDSPPAETPNREPVANASAAAIYLGEELAFDGSASSDPDGDMLSYSWQLVSSPPGSALFELPVANTQMISFAPDTLGDYLVRLIVTDPYGATSSIDVEASVTAPVEMLSYRPVDVEYSKSLDRMILVSEVPNRVHILNAESMEEQTISLNLVPTAVSVSPDGLRAAIGHDGWVSYVNLSDASLIDVIPVSTKAIDVVLAGNGYIYVFPETDQWESIYSLNIETKLQTTNGGFGIYAGTLAKLHPGGNYMYGADNGLSPSDLEKYAISDGTASVLYDSPYHGDYDICGDLWFSEDGLRIFTKCANVFRASESQESDMTYNGSFSGVARIAFAAHSSAANEVAVLPLPEWWDDESDAGTKVALFSYDFLGFDRSIDIPEVIVGNKSYDSYGEYIFYSADGMNKYLVFQVDPDSSLLNDYGIWKVTPN